MRKTRWPELAIAAALVFGPLAAWWGIPRIAAAWAGFAKCENHRALYWASEEDRPKIQNKIDGLIGFRLLRTHGERGRLHAECPDCEVLLQRAQDDEGR